MFSEGEAETGTGSQVIVLRFVNKIITHVGEQTDVGRETIFKANAGVPKDFIVLISAIQAMLVSYGGDSGERIVDAKRS